MTDADDAGLVGAFHAQMRRGAHTTAVETFTEIMKEMLTLDAVRQREIEELRRERDAVRNEAYRIQTRLTAAQIALGEALNVIAPLMKVTYLYAPVSDRSATDARNAASAFAAKHGGRDAKVETTLTLEQLDAALKLNGSLRAFDAGYAKGFAAGLEAGAEIVWAVTWLSAPEKDLLSDAIRERAREEKAKP